MQVLDFGYVNLIETWGSDERIIESARMSTNKGFQGWGPKHQTPEVCEKHPQYCRCVLQPGDEKLLKYLWDNKHLTPFEQCGLTFEIQAPIFVVREWHRHRTQSYNELSGRYAELPDLYYIPSIERLMAGKQNQKNKQGSAEGFTEEFATAMQLVMENAVKHARDRYEYMLGLQVSRELARLVIPVNQYTRFRASANLRNWLHFLELRLGKGAQYEILQYAKAVAHVIEEHFPRTYELFKADA